MEVTMETERAINNPTCRDLMKATLSITQALQQEVEKNQELCLQIGQLEEREAEQGAILLFLRKGIDDFKGLLNSQELHGDPYRTIREVRHWLGGMEARLNKSDQPTHPRLDSEGLREQDPPLAAEESASTTSSSSTQTACFNLKDEDETEDYNSQGQESEESVNLSWMDFGWWSPPSADVSQMPPERSVERRSVETSLMDVGPMSPVLAISNAEGGEGLALPEGQTPRQQRAGSPAGRPPPQTPPQQRAGSPEEGPNLTPPQQRAGSPAGRPTPERPPQRRAGSPARRPPPKRPPQRCAAELPYMYTCCECGKSFSKFSRLTRHEAIHTRQTHSQGGKSRRYRSKLRHQRLQDRGNEHHCHQCGKSFVHRSSLRRHLAAHQSRGS